MCGNTPPEKKVATTHCCVFICRKLNSLNSTSQHWRATVWWIESLHHTVIILLRKMAL